MGAPPIHGELLKLDIAIGQTNVVKCMAKRRGPPSQGWKMANIRGTVAVKRKQRNSQRGTTAAFSRAGHAVRSMRLSEIRNRLQPEYQCVWIRVGAARVDHLLDVRPHLQAGERPVGIVELHGVFVALHGHRAEGDQVLAGQVLQLFREGDAAVDVLSFVIFFSLVKIRARGHARRPFFN
jgi:hypothetical protein